MFESNIWLYDCEVFAQDWIIVFRCLKSGEVRAVHNDNYTVAEFLDQEKPVLGGYNVKHYDQWILKAIYYGATPEEVKELNDFIVRDGNDGWNFPLLNRRQNICIQFDLMDDIPVPLRLKEIEGNLGMSIEESSVPFDIERPLTEAELKETVRYCTHDVEATVELLLARKSYLQSKIDVGAMKGLGEAESLRLTNAKLTAVYLDARYQERDDEFEYEFPDNLQIEKYTEILRFFRAVDYKKKLKLEIAGVPHTIAWGGLHGALECYREESTRERRILHIDVTSYYPSLMIQNGYMSRNVPDPEEYRRVYDRRVAAKQSGDKAAANALKLVLNTTYGAMKNPYNPLYDPKMANAVCISGQLYLIDLIEKMESLPSFRLIQSNTDGLIISIEEAYIRVLKLIVEEWEERTGFHMGFDEIEKLVQKDVNNYIMRGADGSIEVKGGYVSNYAGGDFQNRSLVVVARAVVANLLDGVPVEQTIRDCTDIRQFQAISKAGHTYDKVIYQGAGGEVEVQSVNRVYASVDPVVGTLYKVKTQAGRRDKIANLPSHCCIDNQGVYSMGIVDTQFYIDLAQKRVNDYLGVKPPKKERKKRTMAATKNRPEAQEIPAQGLGQKLMLLREKMNGFSWEKDGKNRHQSYEYITEKQYKNNFRAALAAAGLDFRSSLLEYQFVPTISDKQNMMIAKFQFEIIDRDAGERETYVTLGTGADTGDKGLYKAYTGALKYFLANTFLVAEGGDPESDEDETRDEKPRYTPPERREDIKKKIADPEAPATEEQLETIAEGILMLESAGQDADVAAAFAELLETELTRTAADETIEAIASLLPGDDAA